MSRRIDRVSAEPAPLLHPPVEDINAAEIALAALETGDMTDQRRLSRAGGADQRNHLPRFDRQIDVAKRLFAAKALRQFLDGNSRHQASPIG